MAFNPGDDTGLSDDDILAAAGFSGPAERTIETSALAERHEDEIVASVFSLSYAAPRHFGPRHAEFERDLRALLRRTAPDGLFCEQPRDIRISFVREQRKRARLWGTSSSSAA